MMSPTVHGYIRNNTYYGPRFEPTGGPLRREVAPNNAPRNVEPRRDFNGGREVNNNVRGVERGGGNVYGERGGYNNQPRREQQQYTPRQEQMAPRQQQMAPRQQEAPRNFGGGGHMGGGGGGRRR